MDPTTTHPRTTLVAEAVVWAGVVACVAGLLVHRLWEVLPAGRFGETLLLAGLASGLAWPLSRWRRIPRATALLLVWAGVLVAMAGPMPVLATALLLVAATGLGSWLVGPSHPAMAAAVGLALFAVVGGWLAPLPVHRGWTWAPVLFALVAWRWSALKALGSETASTWNAAVAASPRAAMWSVLLLGVASAGAWLPTLQHDDVAYHLGLPWQWMTTGRYVLDPTHQVWAMAPWAGDVLHAIAQVLAQAEARGPVNVGWLILTCAGLWRLGAALVLPAHWRWGTLALFGSLPLVPALMASMQTETAATAATLLLASLVIRPLGQAGRSMAAGVLLFALLLALKPVHALAALPLLTWAALRQRALLSSWRWLLAAAAALVLGASSYTYAWHVAGNPVLPLFNGVFQSSYFGPYNFADARWHAGFDAALGWRMTFQTSRYLEAWDGGIGFVLVALSGAALVALWHRPSRALAVCAVAAMIVPLLGMQYARYAHPGLVLLLPAVVAGLHAALPAQRARWVLIGTLLLNLAFQANAHWVLHTGMVKRSVGHLGRDVPLLERYAPERVLAQAIRERAPESGAVLVLASSPAYAELGHRGRTLTWYSPHVETAGATAERDGSGRAFQALLAREGITEVLLRPAELTPAQRAGLQRARARPVLAVGDAEWWQLPRGSAP
ncbi:MAG: hypothetical protein NDI59_08460 [Lysobacter sp.]|nr:hypothetical protein [Lysobacter sp.]